MKKNRKKIYRRTDCLLCGKDNSWSDKDYAPVVRLHIGVYTDERDDVTVYTLCDMCWCRPDKRALAEIKIEARKETRRPMNEKESSTEIGDLFREAIMAQYPEQANYWSTPAGGSTRRLP